LPMNELTTSIQNAFKEARRSLKHDRLRSWFLRPMRPWVLLIGPKEGGKTSLLMKADIPLQSPGNKSLTRFGPTYGLDWWIGNDAVFVDSSGTMDASSWRETLTYLSRWRKPYPFNSIILVIDAVNLTQRPELGTLIHTLQDFHKTLPLTIVINKCDRIKGFNEFFTDISQEQQQQLFGFSMHQSDGINSPVDLFVHKYHEFLKNINDTLLWRLHHQQNIERRARMIAFPLQMEQLERHLLHVFTELPNSVKTIVHGVYFTSASQDEQILDLLHHNMLESFHLSQQTTLAKITDPGRALFVHDLFANISNSSDFPIAYSSKKVNQRLLALPIAAAFVVASSFWWHTQFQQHLLELRRIDQTLAHTPSTSPAWLGRLNSLAYAQAQLQSVRPKASHIGIPSPIPSLGQIATNEYKQALQTDLLRYCMGLLERNVTNHLNNPLALYSALKLVVMLNDPKHFDREALQQWLNNRWQQDFANQPKTQQALSKHLNALLALPKLQWPVDNAFITRAQSKLKDLPLASMAYLELQGRFQSQAQPIADASKIPGIDFSKAKILPFYSNANFDDIINHQIPKAAAKLVEGDWVMGYRESETMSEAQQQSLITSMRALYLKEYTNAWLAVIPSIQVTKPENFSDISASIAMLTQADSPFIKLLKQIIENIARHSKTSATDAIDSNDYTTLQAYVQNDKRFAALKDALKQLTLSLNQVARAGDVDKASYQFVVQRFNESEPDDALNTAITLASSAPAPLKGWFSELAEGSWKMLLNSSRQYINTLWQTMVLPNYDSDIKLKFPVFQNSRNDIDLKQFNTFFGPGGTLESFFNFYIKPFVDMSKQYWQLKRVNGSTIGFSDDSLQQFIRGSLIQRMFYSSGSSNPELKFTLTPLNMNKSTIQVRIDIDGQKLVFNELSQEPIEFHWPGEAPGNVAVEFSSIHGETATISSTGTWAWLRLVLQSKLDAGINAKNFKLSISSGNFAAQFNLTAEQSINPYLPNVLTAFRCPGSL